MNPVLIEEVSTETGYEDNEDDEEQTFHSDCFWEIQALRAGGGNFLAGAESIPPFQSRPETDYAVRAIDTFIT
jgi:hypothetical protein